MQVSRTSSAYFAQLFQTRSASSSEKTQTSYHLGSKDTVSISEEALEKSRAGATEAMPFSRPIEEATVGLGGFAQSILQKLKALLESSDGDVSNTILLPENMTKLKAVEAEIEKSGSTRELEQRKMILVLFGDEQILSETDIEKGIQLLNTLMPDEKDPVVNFKELIAVLKKSLGIESGETHSKNEEDDDVAETEKESKYPDLPPEMQELMSELAELLKDFDGIELEISVRDNEKQTRVIKKNEENQKDRQGIFFNIMTEISLQAERRVLE